MSLSSEDHDATNVSVAVHARVGRTLAEKWTLEEVLGIGGMGAVYGARHRNGKRVAIKLLHVHLAMTGSIRKRFLREGHVANRVEHPDALAILDDGETDDGEAFLVMERLDGETLDARRKRAGLLPPAEAASLTARVLDVLAAAHAHGVIHRDIKPENVFLTSEGAVKVLDFGIASVRDAEAGSSLATRPGTTRGTPTYMAPEQARGSTDIDARTDLWAVGALLFTLLTGETVHRADNAMQVLFLAGTQPARPVRSVAPDVPARLAAIVDRALSFDPAERWPDAASMRRPLEAFAAGAAAPREAIQTNEATTLPEETLDGPLAHAPPSARRGRSLVLVALAAAGLLAWALGTHAASTRPPPDPGLAELPAPSQVPAPTALPATEEPTVTPVPSVVVQATSSPSAPPPTSAPRPASGDGRRPASPARPDASRDIFERRR